MKRPVFFVLLIFLLIGTGFTAVEVIPTSLKINIRNSLGNTESGVSVTLYGNQEDFKKEENPVQQGLTDEKGMVTFKNLEAKIYFVAAEKGDMSNFGMGVQTNTLEAKKLNKVTIIIE
jgi:hypothetical protein